MKRQDRTFFMRLTINFIILVLSLAAAFLFVACGNDEEKKPDDDTPDKEVSVCHIELDYDLSEGNRFYYLNEPFYMGFYVFGSWVHVAPKVNLVFDDTHESIEIPYYYPNMVEVTGFDSKTVGTKTITVKVFNILHNNQYCSATTTYEVEVKDYDRNYYGYDELPEDIEVVYPNGFTLTAKAKNEVDVIAYNWLDASLEGDDHAEQCSLQSYNPYNFFTGYTAFTNTFESPTSNSQTDQFKLLTIYHDMTRVYTPKITVSSTMPEDLDQYDYAHLGEYAFKAGETLDLAKLGIGSGTIKFHDNGEEFTFDNVIFTNDKVKSDFFRNPPGFEFMFDESKDYKIHLVGNNYITNTYYNGGSGIGISLQRVRTSYDSDSTITIDGDGSLHFIGGEPAFYTNCPLVIDAELSFASYLGRLSNGIDAEAIHLTKNARIYSTNIGTGILAMHGNILIDEGAVINMDLTLPRLKGTYSTANAIQAAGDIMIKSKDVSISMIANTEIFEDPEGVLACIAICSDYGNVYLDGANVDIHILASSSNKVGIVFDQALGIATSENSGAIANKGVVSISNSDLSIDLQANLFNGVFALYGVNGVKIENSNVDINVRCITGLNGIYCSRGSISIDSSKVTVIGNRALLDLDSFGMFSVGNFVVKGDDTEIIIEFGSGVALAVFVGQNEEPSTYEEGYVARVLPNDLPVEGMGTDYAIGAFSIMQQIGVFNTFETVYDLTTEHIAPATTLHINMQND